MNIVSCKCLIHTEQHCGIKVETNVPLPTARGVEITVPQFCSKEHTNPHAYVYSYLASRYCIRRVSETPQIFTVIEAQRLYFEWYRDFYLPKSQIPLRPVTDHKNIIGGGGEEVRLAPFVYELTLEVDKVLNSMMGLRTISNETAIVKTLQGLCRQRIPTINSILFDKVEVGGEMYPWWYYTTSNAANDPLRGVRLLKEFSFDTTQRGPVFANLRRYVSGALVSLERALKTEQYVGKFRFQYSPQHMKNIVKMRTSGGILNADVIKFVSEEITYRIVNSGNKLYLYEAAVREVHELIHQLAHEKEYLFQPLNITKLKAEIKILIDKVFSKFPEASTKVREFFIPSLPVTLLSDLVHEKRMLIERGDMITIGVTAWYGGWYQLAVIMNFDNPDLFWVDGDITALDKHITDWQLYLYLAAGQRYYAWSKMSCSERRLLKRIYLVLLYHVTNKITLQPGTIWRLIMGVMYSGGKETSHGDSWIMALIFYLYIEHIKHTFPFYSDFIEQCLILEFIKIIIYGDDHIWCAPKRLRRIMGANSFCAFLKDFLGMELRDFKEYDSFLSIVDKATGVFRYQGPKFLKRYFIASDIPGTAPVLPYKPYLESCVRLCAVLEEDDYPGLILKAIGQAWDTTGTNPITYAACRAAYDFACQRCQKTPLQIYKEYLLDPTKAKIVKNLVRKLNMRAEEFFESFPPMSLLLSRHAYVPSLCNNKPVLFKMGEY